MQINKIRIINFKQFKAAEITFPEGLTGFIGSNGSGKSTILEAVSYALYGRTSNAKEAIRNDNSSAKEPVEIEVQFSDKSKDYTIRRELRGKNLSAQAELFCEGALIASQATEVNKQIIKLLKIDYKNFKRSYFSEQKDVAALLSMKTGERQVEIRKMLGLEKLDKLEERVKEHSKELRMMISLQKEQLLTPAKVLELQNERDELLNKKQESVELHQQLQKELEESKKNYQSAKQQVSDYELLRNKYIDLQKQLSVTRSRISGIDAQVKSLCEELSDLNNKKQKLAELLPYKQQYAIVSEELLRLLGEEAKAAKASALAASNDDYELIIAEKSFKIKEKEIEISQLLPLEYEIREKRLMISSIDALINSKNQTRDTIKDSISSAESHLRQKQKRMIEIKKLGKDSPCPECERPLNEHYDKLLSEYGQQIEELTNQVTVKTAGLLDLEEEIAAQRAEKDMLFASVKETEFNYNKIPSLRKDVEHLASEISRAQKKVCENKDLLEDIGEISFSRERLDAVKAEEVKLKVFDTDYNNLSAEVKRIPAVETKLAKLREEKSSLVSSEEELCRETDLINYSEKEYNSLKEECNLKEALKDELQHKYFSAEGELKEILNKIKTTEDTLRKNESAGEEIKQKEEEITLYDRLAVFINNFKQRIASQEMPAISLEASRLFSSITRGRYNDLIIDADYEIYVNREGNKVLLNTLSGGEKDLAGLCLRIAISKRIAALAGRENMGFLALDEVFGSQDETRREDLMNALYRISMDFRQIFVISHNEDVKESFPNRLHVRKEGKYSVVDYNHSD